MALKDRTDTLIKQFAQSILQNVVNNQGFSIENKINDINKSLHDECREELVFTEKDIAASDTTANKVIIGVSNVNAPRTISISPAEEFDGNAIIVKDETGLADMNPITVVSLQSKLIDGAADAQISTAYGVLRLYYTGTAWFSW